MENSEKIIASLQKVSLSGDLRIYNLIITNRRFVAIYSSSLTSYGGGLFGQLIGEGVAKIFESRKKEENIHDLNLDEMLKKDKRNNFSIIYGDIKQIKLQNLKLEVSTAEIKKTFQPTKEQFEQISTILPRINVLKEKLEQ